MADKIQKIQITLPNGKQQWVTIPEFNNSRNSAYAKAMVRMIDNEGNEYDVEKTSLNKAQKLGLRPFIFADNAPKPQPTAKQQPTTTAQPSTPTASPTTPTQTYTPTPQPPSGWGYSEMVNPQGLQPFGAPPAMTMAEQKAKNQIQAALDVINGRKTDGTNAERDNYQRAAQQRTRSAVKQMNDQIEYATATGQPLVDEFNVKNLREIDNFTPTGNEGKGFSMLNFGVAPTVARDEKGIPVLNDQGMPVKGMVHDEVRASNQRQMEAAARQRELGLHKKTIDEKIADAKKRAAELEKKLKGGLGTQLYQGKYGMVDTDRRNIRLELNNLEQEIRSLEAVRDKDDLALGGFFRALGNTVFTAKTWDFGISDLAAMGKMEEIKGKLDRKENLTNDEIAFANSQIGANSAMALEDEQMGNIYRYTKIGGESLPYMADFILTGGYSGLSKWGARQGLNAAAKLFTTKLGRGIAQMGGRNIAAATLKNTGVLIGDLAGAYAMATTIQAGKTTADILKRHQGDLYVDENGDFKFEGGESLLSATAHGVNAAMIENYTEKLGEHLPGINVPKIFAKAGLRNASRFLSNMTSKEWYKTVSKISNRAGVQGYPSEVIEEYINIPLNAAIVGDNSMSELLDPQTHGDILGGMALSIGMLGAVGLGGHLVNKSTRRLAYNRYNSLLNKADAAASQSFGDNWEGDMKDAIDNTTNENMGAMIAFVKDHPNMTEQQRTDALAYIERLIEVRGFNLGLNAQMNDDTTPPQPYRNVVVNVNVQSGVEPFAVISYDENGNLIERKKFMDEEKAQAYKEKLDIQRMDNDAKNVYSSIFVKDTDGSLRQQMDDMLSNIGMTLDDIKPILNKNPFKRTDEEQNAIDQMVQFASQLVYPENEVHEEFDNQNGQDLADGTPVGDQPTIDTVNSRQANARQQWDSVANPDLQSAIADLVSKGNTTNDIFQYLIDNEYSEDIISAFAELCNAEAFKDGFISRTGEKINDEVEQQVSNVTFNGTLNGQQQPSIVTVTDDQGNQYTLAGGNITVDQNGIMSSDGLVIMRDQAGNFIQRPDTNGLIFGGQMSVDDYRNQLLTQTQEAVTAQIQSTEAPMVEDQSQDPSLQPPTQDLQPTTPPTNTQPQEQQQQQSPSIPVDENNNPLYHKAPIEATVENLYNGELDEEDIPGFITANINDAFSEYDKLSKKKPKITSDKAKYVQAKKDWQQKLDEAKQKLDYWHNVEQYIQQQTHTTDAEIKSAQDELSGANAQAEFAAENGEEAKTPVQVAGEFIKDAKLLSDDFRKETGLSRKEELQFPGMFASNGKTIAQLAEALVSYDNDNYNGMYFKGDDMEARNAIIEALQTAGGRASLGRNTSAEFEAFDRERTQQREDYYEETYHMSYSDYLAFEEQQMPSIWRRISNFAPEQYDKMVAEYYESLPEDYFTHQNQNNNGTEQNPPVAGSNEILPQPPTNNETGTGQRQDPAAETGNGGKGDNTNDEVSGDALNDGSYQLSDELDENGRQFVLNSKGGLEFGYISDETGLKSAPILLSEGIITNPKTGDGYGLVHIEFRHGDQIRKAGYKSVIDFIEEVGNNYEVIREGKDRFGNQTYLLQLTDKHNNTLIVELSGDGSYWNINTAGIFKRNYARNNKEVYNRHTTTKQSVETAEASQGAEQSDTQTPSSMNAPTPSEGKDTTKSPNSQENQQKTDEKSDEGQKDDVNAEIKKDIEAFIAESILDVQITNYDEENYEAQISVDGKPSNIVVTPPMEQEEGMHAEYRPENSSYQELGDLLDEYNETVDRKYQGLEGEHLAAIFSSVDGAIAFENWINKKTKKQDNPLSTQAKRLLDAIDKGDVNEMSAAKKEISNIINGMSHSELSDFAYNKNQLVKNQDTRAKKEVYRYICNEAKKRADSLVDELNRKIQDKYPGVNVVYDSGSFWITASKDSKYKKGIESLDNDRRWLNENSVDSSSVQSLHEDSMNDWIKAIDARLSEVETEKTWDDMTEEERMQYAFSQPLLTEEEINNAPTDDVNKANALAFVKGQESMITKLSYYLVYTDVKHSTGSSLADNEAGDTSQLDETAGRGSTRGRTEGMRSGLGDMSVGTTDSGRTDTNQGDEQLLRGENGEGRTADDTGEGSNQQVPGDQQPVGRPDSRSDKPGRGSVDNGNGHNVSQQGRNGRSRKNPDSDRRRTDKADRAGDTGNAELNSESIDAQIEAELEKFGDLLGEYRNAKKGNGGIIMASAIGIPINQKKIEIFGKLIFQGAKIGYLMLRKGLTSLAEWSAAMRKILAPQMREAEISDTEIDEFIKEMWHCNLPIDGETHTIAEWSKIMQQEKLREAIRTSLEEKRKKQLEAEPIEVKIADKNNIEQTLPYLLPLQQDDVYKAEMQFFDESHNDRQHAYGKGFMFTNGTGTGKTYTGLGIAKRFIKQGKGRILILTPSTTKVSDWVTDAANLNIEANDLEKWAKNRKQVPTTSKGEGVVVTTYANFRQNQALLEDEFDLVIYDESHRLLENKKGGETEGSKQHYMLTNKNEMWAFNRLQKINPVYNEIQRTREKYDEEYDKEKAKFPDEKDAKMMLPMLGESIGVFPTAYPNLKAIKQKYDNLVKQYNDEVKPQLEAQAKESVKKTKVVFLSATPFNTKENLGYTESYIFSYPEENGGRIGARSQFYLDTFGAAYRWRYNRLETRSNNPDAVAKQEVAFSDYLQNTLGTMSGRVIDSEFDYSRDFPTATLDRADELNKALNELAKEKGIISKAYWTVMGDYNYTSALFEAMKVSCILPRMEAHLDAGRKIVLFHRRMETSRPIDRPFRAIYDTAMILAKNMTNSAEKKDAIARIEEMKDKYSSLFDWEETLDLRVPRAQIADAFGLDGILFFSGKETSKQKEAAVAEFNNDSSNKKIIIIQEASGKEGISLHDTTGKNQRVLISLAMPQSPITALQVEGRIYRIGNKSNAIFEYPLLGLDHELIIWGQRFNAQIGTTENLALGTKARNLRESFAKSVIEHSGDVPLDGQGIGGKELDEAVSQDTTDPFDRAVLDFYANQRLSGRRDNREGKDYYPTPEPLGFMMVEWANLSEGESALEPSAGHGAIARYVPYANSLMSIEPSASLFGKLQVQAGGIGRKFKNTIFEDYDIINKHDAVIMNPPFGSGGRLAVDHVAKAFQHLSEGGRIVAIIPRGSTDSKFDKWIEGEKNAALVGEIQLPNITFQNAGTQVNTRVVIIDKISNEKMRNEALDNKKTIELPNNYEKIEDFFGDLRGISMPPRTIDQKTKNDRKIMPIIKELKDDFGDKMTVEFTPTGVLLSGAGFDYLNLKGNELKLHVAAQYARANKILKFTPEKMTRVIGAYEAIKKMALKLADMSAEEMDKFVKENIKDSDSNKTISQQFTYAIKQNTRTGELMHVVTKNRGVNLTEDEYTKVRDLAKNNGGYWSKFLGGFVFESELAAKSFLNGGNVPAADNESPRLAYSNSTNNVNNSRIIPEDVDKSVSLQIENEFDSAIESLNLTEEERTELDKQIGDYSNSSTIELEDIFYINNSRLGLRNEKKDNFSEMLWRRGSAVSPSTTNAGGNIPNEKSGAEPTASSNGEYSPVVSRRGRETEGANTARGNEVQGQYNRLRDIRNTGGDRLLLQEGRRIEEKVVSKTPRTELSSNQRRLLAAQYAISRELVYRDIRLAALKENLGIEEGKPTSLDEIAAIFEKTNTDQQVKALFDKILAVNKRLGTSVEVAASDANNNSGSAGTRRDVHYYLDGFTRTSAGKIQVPVVLAHELLHQGTIGAINLVRKGKAEGVLTKEQIDAVNTILDIYNKVKADSERLSESKRGLADPYEFAAQMVDPRQRKALSMSPLQRIMAAANELKAQGNNSLWNRIKNALKTLFDLSDLKKMDNAINTLLDTFNETIHDISMTDVDQNGWGYTSIQLFDKYPTWLSGQTTGTGQHTTQITSTVNTYKKIGDWMKSQGMDGASVLDASSGLGKGTEALRDMGFNVEDVEPYPSENRTAPTYLKYEDIKGKYDVVISNAVLNVIPDDWRADVLKNMADKVKPGGKMIINVRDAKEMERQKQKIELDSPSEILVTDKAGNIRAYQKGFTQKELADWIQSELGEGWTIETAKPSNSGISGRAVVVTRKTGSPLRYRKVTDSMQPTQANQEKQSQMRAHAQAVAEKLNTKLTFTTSDKLEGEKKNAKGWYDKKTGEVVIVLDNNKDNFDIEQTVIHEVVGHKGLRALLGSKGLYRLLDSIYANLDQQAKEAIDEATRRNGWRQYTAIEEYLAEQAENTVWDAKSASLWQNVKHYLTEALRTLGFMIRPNLKDARYWLWLSKNNLKRSDVMSEIKRNALLNKIERMGAPVLDLLSNDKQDSLAPQEMFRQIVQNDIKHKPLQEAFQDYAISLKDFLKIITEGLGRNLMDNENAYLGENQMGSIASALAQKFVNKQINHLRKTIIGLSDVFSDAKYKISRTADELYKDGQGIINKCEAYLYTKHGLERNRVLYVRDLNKRIEKIAMNTGTLKRVDVMDIIDKFNEDFQNYKDWLSDELKNHNINFGQYLHSLDDFIRTYAFNHPSANPQPHEINAINHLNQWYKQHIAGKYDPNKNDMSGLSSFSEYGLGDNFDEQKAIDSVEAIEHSIGDKRLEELWKAVQDVTQFAIDTEYKSGMLSKKAYDRCKSMFEWYVPLRGVSEDTMEDLYAYLGGENDNGSAVQTAKGRQTLANTPLATAYGMALQAINNGVRNQNNQRMYRAVNAWLKNNPNKLAPATIIDCWYEIDNNGNFDMKVPNITDNMTPEQITAETQRFEQEMRIKQQQGIAFKKDIKSFHVRPFSKKSHANDHIVYVKVNGVRKMIVFNGDPRPARVLRGEMNPSITKVNDLLRKLSALNTAWNPTFTLKNLARDTFESYNNIVINENLAYLNKFKSNQLRLMGDGFWAATDIFKKNKSSYLVAFYKWKSGKEPSSYIEKMFFEFMENGGATGFMEYKKMEELQSMLYKNKSVATIARNPFNIFGIAFGTANELLENLNRFATYLTSREMGRSVMTSVNNAKEITLNFNRRGAGDKTAIYGNTNKEAIYGWTSWFFRNTRMFFNPSVQSMYRILSNHTRHPFKSALLDVGVFMLLSSMMPMINAFLISLAGEDGDDDRYSDLSAWTRRNNICIYNPFQKTWITIPIPPNIAAFYGMGDVAYGYIFDKSFQSGYGVWSDIASQLAMIMPMDYIGKNGTIKPLDSIFMETVVGDVANPVLEIAMNKNWLGYEIYKENEWNGNDPEWQRCYSNTNQLFVDLSKSINSIGNDYEYLKGPWDNRLFNPGILQHLVESYTGGFGKDVTNAVSLIKEPDPNKIPVYRGFVRTPDNTNRYQRVRVKYNVYKDEADKLYDNLRKLQKNGDLGDTVAKIKYIGTEEKRNPEYRRMVEVKKKEKYIKFCQDMMKNAKDDITKDAWELELNKTKREVVDICDQIE